MIDKGRESGSPEMDTETMIQALRGQQARNLYNARKCDKVTRSAKRTTFSCYRCVNNPMRKERTRLVPAAAVKPALQVVGNFIGLKVSVAGLKSSWLNLVA